MIKVVDLAEEPPRRVSAPRPADLTGCFCPFRPDEPTPVMTQVERCPDWFVCAFSTPEKCHAHMTLIGITAYHLKVISDGADFAEDVLSAGLRIMFDPVQVEGRARWTEIAREGELPPVDAETGAALGNGARA